MPSYKKTRRNVRSKRQKGRSLKQRNRKSRKVMRGGWEVGARLINFFRRSPRVAPAPVEPDITEDPCTTEIEKLYMSLPNTYSCNSTHPQLEHMLDATVRYFVATNGLQSDDIMTFHCKCVIILYNKNANIMIAIIKSIDPLAPLGFKGGWEIHQGDLRLIPISPVKLELTDTGVTNIVDITISKSTIDGAIASKIKSSSSTASQ